MNEKYSLVIGSKAVNSIKNLRFDQPHYIGEFEPTSQFEHVREHFLAAHAYLHERRLKEFHEEMAQICGLGIEVKAPDGKVVFKRIGLEQHRGDIGIIHVKN